MARNTLPLRLTQDGYGPPTLMLGGMDITTFVAADGLSIDYPVVHNTAAGDGYAIPTVTLKFAPGRLNLDFDIELLETLLADAKARQ